MNFWAVSSVEMAGELRKRSYRRALEAWGGGWSGDQRIEKSQWK